jgi:hypothetical protein
LPPRNIFHTPSHKKKQPRKISSRAHIKEAVKHSKSENTSNSSGIAKDPGLFLKYQEFFAYFIGARCDLGQDIKLAKRRE